MLTRGRTVPDVDEAASVPVILKAGQLSLHHPRILHGSGPNLSGRRRIGFAIQSYIGGDVAQVIGRMWVQQARGTGRRIDDLAPRPTAAMLPDDIAFRDMTNAELSKIFYAGAGKTGRW